MGPPRTSYRFARLVGILLACSLALATAFLAGKGGGSAGPRSDAGGSSISSPSPSRAGSVAAYIEQQAQLADPELWLASPDRRAVVLREILGSRTLERSVEQSIQGALGRRNGLGRALHSGRSVLARSAALGYRVVSYSARQAVIEAWVFSLLGGEGIPLDLRLARYRATERWRGGVWRLAETRSVGEGSAVRFRGAPQLSARLTASFAGFRRLRSEP